MPKPSAWEKIPKPIQTAIVLIVLVAIALVITWVLFDKTTEEANLKFDSENMAIFITGSVAVFVLVLMVLSKEFRRISAVLTIVGVVGLTATYVYKTNSFQEQPVKPVMGDSYNKELVEIQSQFEQERTENRRVITQMQNEIQQYEQRNEAVINERNGLQSRIQQLQSINQAEGGNTVELEQQIRRLENENIQLQNIQQRLNAEITELRRALETNTVPNDQLSTYQFQFPLSNPNRNFLQQLIRLDSEYRERNSRSLKSEYQERARELYIDTRQE